MNDSFEKMKVYVLCRYALESSLYTSWLNDLPIRFEVVEQCASDWIPPNDCGILLTHEHYRWEEIHCLRKTYEQARVPTLVLADGVLEYRNTWQNPTIPDASIYQPLMADKIACIGHASAHMINAWGNRGKTEVVGIPRLDHLFKLETESVKSKGLFRLLVATATTPAFTDSQRKSVVESLLAVKNVLDANTHVNERRIEVSWRLTDHLESEIGLPGGDADSISLTQAIQSCDAVITTPSTTFLESALLRRPTAVLDFSNSPQFIPSAWSITSRDHLLPVVQELADPPAGKLDFQDFVLHDNLYCQSSATERLIELITKLVEIGLQYRSQHKTAVFPDKILSQDDNSDEKFDRQQLNRWFPGNPAFEEREPMRMQAELSQAIHRLGTIPRELADKNNQIAQLQSALDESRRRVADVRARLFKLRKILGIGKENQDAESEL